MLTNDSYLPSQSIFASSPGLESLLSIVTMFTYFRHHSRKRSCLRLCLHLRLWLTLSHQMTESFLAKASALRASISMSEFQDDWPFGLDWCAEVSYLYSINAWNSWRLLGVVSCEISNTVPHLARGKCLDADASVVRIIWSHLMRVHLRSLMPLLRIWAGIWHYHLGCHLRCAVAVGYGRLPLRARIDKMTTPVFPMCNCLHVWATVIVCAYKSVAIALHLTDRGSTLDRPVL